MTLKEDDPRMLLWQEQRSGDVPSEDIWLHVQNPRAGQEVPNSYGLREPQYLPIDIAVWGAAKVRAYLEEGNMWSGRARADSPLDELTQHQEARKEASTKRKQDVRAGAVDIVKDKRRSLFKIPFVGVKTDLTPKDAVRPVLPRRKEK